MTQKEINKIEKDALKAIAKLSKEKQTPSRGIKFAIILSVCKIAMKALISILKAIDSEKFKKLIGYLEQALEIIESL